MIDELKIVVADDNESFRKGFVELLNKQKKIKVIGEAKNGMEAIKLTSLLKPNLVMIDISMPGMDGISAARIIKKQMPEICVVIITIYESSIYKILSDSISADGFVCKATLSEDLPKVLNKIIPNIIPFGGNTGSSYIEIL